MPGMVKIGELISSMMILISFSISLISASSSWISLMVCFNSKDLAGIWEPMEVPEHYSGIFSVSALGTFRKQICKSGKVCRCNSWRTWELREQSISRCHMKRWNKLFQFWEKDCHKPWNGLFQMCPFFYFIKTITC